MIGDKRPFFVTALQYVGCFCIAIVGAETGTFSFPVAIMLGALWFLAIEISWETRFPW